ncbi:MAG: indole-3-glycerol phosphate synthase TrpC [Flavobacteriaceae bacterium]|jgi:indole-3-glycerol phosphate synthase|nr:indole-3-glycerol phosphate synthase TrpC [Flavobacteriaceae bacterium]
MNNILETIADHKRTEVESQKKETPLSVLKNLYNETNYRTVSFKQALQRSPSGIIAEFKRRSPSKGWIHPDADAKTVASAYENAGAAALSVLTDETFFGGTFHDFRQVRETVSRIPVLRKDFIVDEYQIYQSKVLGADVILLIAACLTQEQTARFAETAHELGLEVLLEIHNERELEYITESIEVVGVNNRDLTRFVTDVRISFDLADQIPADIVKISESGISDIQTVKSLQKRGYQGFLMGENFMKNEDPAGALKEFLKELES